MPPSAQPEPVEALGYTFSAGGISNQKLALLGLFAAAAESAEMRLRLPDIFTFDYGQPRDERRLFGDIFFADVLRDFAERRGIEIVADGGPRAPDWWDYFVSGTELVAKARSQGRQSPRDLASDFFRSLVPRLRHGDLFTDLHLAAFSETRVSAVVQLRIEADWREHAETVLEPASGEAEEHPLSAVGILAKVQATLPELGPALYVVCDERYLPAPKEEIRTVVRRELGYDLVWKSDLASEAALAPLSPLELSLLDFEMAVASEVFVGNTRSTFANLATFERYSRTRTDVDRHFACNLPGRLLHRRSDNGAFFVGPDAVALTG